MAYPWVNEPLYYTDLFIKSRDSFIFLSDLCILIKFVTGEKSNIIWSSNLIKYTTLKNDIVCMNYQTR